MVNNTQKITDAEIKRVKKWIRTAWPYRYEPMGRIVLRASVAKLRQLNV